VKEITIIINATEHTVDKGSITFEEVVGLAYENPPYGENTLFSVTYRRGHGNKPEGTLDPGGETQAKDGMIFDVTPTDKS
jgi:multiubiquitin